MPSSLTAVLRTPLLAGLLTFGGAAAAQDAATGGDTVGFGTTPDTYTVQQGDTLWEISGRFLGNPEYWPRLWSINDNITNPHWIYPGNRIVFRMGTLIDPPDVGFEEDLNAPYVPEPTDYATADAACGPDVRFDNRRPVRGYLATGFLADKDEVDQYGVVAKARQMKTYHAEGDLLYLAVDDPDAFECGDVVSVYRRVKKKVRHPETRRIKLGSLYEVVAEATVVYTNDDYVSARIRQSWSEVVRGDLVGPPATVAVQIQVDAPRGELEAVLVERTEDDAFNLSTGETVFLDRGRGDGVRVGQSFYITEQRDERLDYKRQDERLPHSVIGRVVVVRVDEDTSAAVITDASKSLYVGARLTQRVE